MTAIAPRQQWDPFALMDRLDDELILKELEGIASDELVYVIKDEKGNEVVGLSKGGVDESCNVLAHRGEVIREIDLAYDVREIDGEQVSLFRVTAARFAVAPDQEVKLDQVIGTKTQPLYFEAALPLTLDSPCPGKKPMKDGKRRTFREMLEQEKGYLEWMAGEFRDEATREFVKRILNGEDVTAQPGRQKNRFWFEQGSAKAGRNARSRLVPANIKAEVIARARQAGKQRVVNAAEPSAGAPPPPSPSSESVEDEPATDESLKLVFSESAKAGITRDTFPQFYQEVIGRPWQRLYAHDVKPLLDAAAKRISVKAKAHEATGATR